MNILEKFESQQIKKLSENLTHPKFYAGDTLKIHLKVREGEKERIQIFEGICIGINNSGINSAFTVRKISYGEGVERVFPLYSPQINKIDVAKSGDVRRSKLYYLRERSGKSARIAEKNKFTTQKSDTKENTNKLSNKIEKPDSPLKDSNNEIKDDNNKNSPKPENKKN